MIFGWSLLQPLKHLGQRHARAWNRLNPTNMKRTLPLLEGLQCCSRLTKHHETHPFGECAVDTHSVAVSNEFRSAGMSNLPLQRRGSCIQNLKHSGSNGVRRMSGDMQFEFERGINEPSDCGGGFGGVCLMILGWSLLEPSNRAAKAACFGGHAAPQPPEQES